MDLTGENRRVGLTAVAELLSRQAKGGGNLGVDAMAATILNQTDQIEKLEAENLGLKKQNQSLTFQLQRAQSDSSSTLRERVIRESRESGIGRSS